MIGALLQPSPVQELAFNLARLAWSLEQVWNPIALLLTIGSIVGVAASLWIGERHAARFFGLAGTAIVLLTALLYVLVAVGVYTSGLCL